MSVLALVRLLLVGTVLSLRRRAWRRTPLGSGAILGRNELLQEELDAGVSPPDVTSGADDPPGLRVDRSFYDAGGTVPSPTASVALELLNHSAPDRGREPTTRGTGENGSRPIVYLAALREGVCGQASRSRTVRSVRRREDRTLELLEPGPGPGTVSIHQSAPRLGPRERPRKLQPASRCRAAERQVTSASPKAPDVGLDDRRAAQSVAYAPMYWNLWSKRACDGPVSWHTPRRVATVNQESTTGLLTAPFDVTIIAVNPYSDWMSRVGIEPTTYGLKVSTPVTVSAALDSVEFGLRLGCPLIYLSDAATNHTEKAPLAKGPTLDNPCCY